MSGVTASASPSGSIHASSSTAHNVNPSTVRGNKEEKEEEEEVVVVDESALQVDIFDQSFLLFPPRAEDEHLTLAAFGTENDQAQQVKVDKNFDGFPELPEPIKNEAEMAAHTSLPGGTFLPDSITQQRFDETSRIFKKLPLPNTMFVTMCDALLRNLNESSDDKRDNVDLEEFQVNLYFLVDEIGQLRSRPKWGRNIMFPEILGPVYLWAVVTHKATTAELSLNISPVS